jgi:hypothetical protein
MASRSIVEKLTRCPVCASSELFVFKGEIGLAYPQLSDVHKEPLLVYADVVVCTDCGIAQFLIPQSQRESITPGPADITD